MRHPVCCCPLKIHHVRWHKSKNVCIQSCHISQKAKNYPKLFDIFGSNLSKMDQNGTKYPSLGVKQRSFENNIFMVNFVCFKGRIDLCLTNRVSMCRNPRGTNETRMLLCSRPQRSRASSTPQGCIRNFDPIPAAYLCCVYPLVKNTLISTKCSGNGSNVSPHQL